MNNIDMLKIQGTPRSVNQYKDALSKASLADKISVKQYADAIQHLTDNTVNTASAIGGLKGLNLINEIIQKKVFNR